MEDQTQPSPSDIVQQSIAGLNTGRDMLVKLPTWPWQAGVVTGFLPMLLLPIITFFIPRGLACLMGK